LDTATQQHATPRHGAVRCDSANSYVRIRVECPRNFDLMTSMPLTRAASTS
jgi:hypothetical protein